jgi:hypothetical protein
MRRIFKFYWLCFKEAWHGSIEAANAWAAIIGALVIWTVLTLAGYQLMLPETFVQGIALTALCLVAAWVALFVLRFIRALPALYWKESDKADGLDRELKIALKQPGADDTKWSMNELFQHIDSEYLENNRWERVGDELRDALFNGTVDHVGPA